MYGVHKYSVTLMKHPAQGEAHAYNTDTNLRVCLAISLHIAVSVLSSSMDSGQVHHPIDIVCINPKTALLAGMYKHCEAVFN